MIKVVAFDYGGVIKLNDNDLFGDISYYLKIDKEVWMQEFFKMDDIYNGGDKGFEDMMYLLASKFSNTEETKSFIKKILEDSKGKSHINTELIDMIKELKSKGYKTPLLSNNSSTLREKLSKSNIIDLFDEIIISGEVGFQKPDPEIFHVLFDKLKVSSNEVVFIDNTEEEFKYAAQIGYIPILFKDNVSLKLDLSKVLGFNI